MYQVTNHDPETGIAYGIIPQHDVMPECLDDCEYDYGKPEEAECPECGEVTMTDGDGDWGDSVVCGKCGAEYEVELPEQAEANSFSIECDGYVVQGECGSYTSTSDLWILKSPYYTIAEKCSPCAPGAGYLRSEERKPQSNSMGEPEKTYALDGDWFDDGIAPYPLWSVETGKRVIEERVDSPCLNCKGKGYRTVMQIAKARGIAEKELIHRLRENTNNPDRFPEVARLGYALLDDKTGNDVFTCWACNGTGKQSEVQRKEVA